MSGQKHKGWRTITEERLSALEATSKNQRNRPEDIDNRQEEEGQAQREGQLASRTRSPLKKTLRAFGILLTLFATPLGIVTGYLALVPKVTIVESEPTNPGEPFSAKFIMSNDGPLGINSVDGACIVADMEYANRTVVLNNWIGQGPSVFKPRMEVGERATLRCSASEVIHSNAPILHANIVMVVSFRPDFTWWRLTREDRFETIADSKGLLHWAPIPLGPK